MSRRTNPPRPPLHLQMHGDKRKHVSEILVILWPNWKRPIDGENSKPTGGTPPPAAAAEKRRRLPPTGSAVSFLTPGPNKQAEDQLSIQATAVRKLPPPAFQAASFIQSFLLPVAGQSSQKMQRGQETRRSMACAPVVNVGLDSRCSEFSTRGRAGGICRARGDPEPIPDVANLPICHWPFFFWNCKDYSRGTEIAHAQWYFIWEYPVIAVSCKAGISFRCLNFWWTRIWYADMRIETADRVVFGTLCPWVHHNWMNFDTNLI